MADISKGHKRAIRSGARHQAKPAKTSSLLTAEEYRVKYLVGGNARHSRLLRYARMRRREARR